VRADDPAPVGHGELFRGPPDGADQAMLMAPVSRAKAM